MKAMPQSSPSSQPELVATPTQFGELVPAGAGVLGWLYVLIAHGTVAALETVWILPIVLPMAVWTLGMRLRYGPDRVSMSVGPWMRFVDLKALDRVSWTMTGGWRSQGTVFLSDKAGHKVPIYVGRFNHSEEWAPLILDAAANCNASVEKRAGSILERARRGQSERRSGS